MNMAGFGARKLAEQSRHRAAAEEAARRQQEEDRLRWEQEQQAWEAEQRAYYDAQARQRQWEDEEEAARQAQEQAQAAADSHVNDDAYGDHGYYEPQPSQSSDSAVHADDYQRSQQARRSKAAQQWYAQEEIPRPPQSPSRHAPSQHHRVNDSYSSDASQFRRGTPRSANQSLDVPGPTADSLPSPVRNLARETIYEDDFEEADEELAANFSRYTCYEGTTDASLASPRGAWSGARKSLFQATTDQPLPMARCADCGESFTFEALTDHACEQVSLPGTPTLALTPLQSLTPLSGTKQEEKQPRSGSPFLDRYDELAASKKSGSGGGSAPRSPLLAHLGGPTRSASTDERSSSREKGRLGLGLNVGDEMQRSQTSPIGSPLSEMGKQEQQQRDGSRRSNESGPSPTSASASASSTSAELRKRIEAQRAAKRQNSGVSPLMESPAATFKQLELEKSPSKLEATPEKLSPHIRSKDELQPGNATASSSVSSSLGTPGSSLLAPGSSPVGLALTPSSSVDRFSDYAKDSSPPPFRDDLLSPKSAQLAWDRMTTQERSACITEARKHQQQPQRGGVVGGGSGTSSLPRSPRLGGKSPKTRDIDLGGIEDLLKDLETSDAVPTRRGKDPPSSSSGSKSRTEKAARRGPPTPLKLGSATTTTTSKPSSSRKKSSHSTKLCCVCMCSLNSSKGRFVEKDGKFFCAEDYKQLYLPKCTKCRQPVEKDAVKSRDGALKGVFHRSCFSCFHCDARFEDGIFFVYENAPYCFDHYSTLAGTSCASCGSGIEGICRQTESGERYHPHCLTCQFENNKTGEFCRDILDDFYVLMGRRLCEHHAQKVQMMMDKVGKKQAKAEKRRTMLKKLA